jgi:4-hydroxy-tetrahydrodipicolinate synthase
VSIPVLDGIITVLTTPFDADGAINLDVLGRHIDFLLEKGVGSILEGGSTGEYYALTLAERKRLLSFVVKHVAGRAQLIAGTNSARPEETIELNDFASALGYQATMLAAPYYSLPTTPQFLTGIRDIETIFAIKESSGSFARMIEHSLEFPHLQRVCGMDDQAVDSFLWGANSWIAGASNFLPAEHVALHGAAVRRKDFILAQKIMWTMMPLFCLLEQGGKYMQCVKYGTELAGIPVGDTRAPLQALSSEEKASFRGLYEGVIAAKLSTLLKG